MRRQAGWGGNMSCSYPLTTDDLLKKVKEAYNKTKDTGEDVHLGIKAITGNGAIVYVMYTCRTRENTTAIRVIDFQNLVFTGWYDWNQFVKLVKNVNLVEVI